jgi:hypothetical protein
METFKVKIQHVADPPVQEAKAEIFKQQGNLVVLDRCIYWDSKQKKARFHQKGKAGDICYKLNGVLYWLSMISLDNSNNIVDRLAFMQEGIKKQGIDEVERILTLRLGD